MSEIGKTSRRHDDDVAIMSDDFFYGVGDRAEETNLHARRGGERSGYDAGGIAVPVLDEESVSATHRAAGHTPATPDSACVPIASRASPHARSCSRRS